MIIRDDNVFINVSLNGELFSGLCFGDVEKLLSSFKNVFNDLKAKEIRSIPNCFAYFDNDVDKNEFVCKVYKTSFGSDMWIMLMKDDYEGYALYENPESHEFELAWYCSELDKPLSDNEEEKIRTCYNPITNS